MKILGKELTDKEIEDRFPMLGMGIESMNENEITIEVTPNRPDMLSEEGFARALASFLDIEKGLPTYEVKRSGSYTTVEKTLDKWPYVVTCYVKNLSFTDEKIREIIQVQEKLAITHLRDRKKGGIGVYPLDKIKLPIVFTTEDLDKIKFRPLEYPEEITGKEILVKHPTGKKYAHILGGEGQYPIFRDSSGIIMSMPPIINSHIVGKITEETKEVFVECTGTDLNALTQALNIITTTFADMGGTIYSMEIIYKDKRIVTPLLRPRKMRLEQSYVNQLLGLNLTKSDIKKFLNRMGIDYEKDEAVIPRYRVDILHPFDLVEDIAIAHGYENFIPEIPKIGTVADESRDYILIRKVSDILANLGLLEVNTYHLTNENNLCKKMDASVPFVELENSKTGDYNILRSWILPSLLEVLSKNKHNKYPQKIFEIGTLFKKEEKEETSVEEFKRLGVIISHSKTDFTEIKQVLDALFKVLDLGYELKETEHSSFIPGRVGRVSVKGNDIAYIGEIHPEVLVNWELELPVSALELNVSELAKFIK